MQFHIELHFNGATEVLENRVNFRFISDKKDQVKAGMIINKIHKPSFSKGVNDLEWTPNVNKDKVNGWVDLYGCQGKETRCCLTWIHTSQDKEERSTLEKRWGNKDLIYVKFGCPTGNVITYNLVRK